MLFKLQRLRLMWLFWHEIFINFVANDLYIKLKLIFHSFLNENTTMRSRFRFLLEVIHKPRGQFLGTFWSPLPRIVDTFAVSVIK